MKTNCRFCGGIVPDHIIVYNCQHCGRRLRRSPQNQAMWSLFLPGFSQYWFQNRKFVGFLFLFFAMVLWLGLIGFIVHIISYREAKSSAIALEQEELIGVRKTFASKIYDKLKEIENGLPD